MLNRMVPISWIGRYSRRFTDCEVSVADSDRFAGSIHAPEGQTIADRLWNETMKELEFAGTLKVLEEMRR